MASNIDPELGNLSDDEWNQVDSLLVELKKYYSDFDEKLGFSNLGIQINSNCLFFVCAAYVNQQKIILTHHNITEVDEHKLSAYLARLIVRRRPITFPERQRGETEEEYELMIRANELFAIYVIENILMLDERFLTTKAYEKIQAELMHRFINDDHIKEMLISSCRILGMFSEKESINRGDINLGLLSGS